MHYRIVGLSFLGFNTAGGVTNMVLEMLHCRIAVEGYDVLFIGNYEVVDSDCRNDDVSFHFVRYAMCVIEMLHWRIVAVSYGNPWQSLCVT